MVCSCTSTENLVQVMHENTVARLRENSKQVNAPVKNRNTRPGIKMNFQYVKHCAGTEAMQQMIPV